MDRDQTPPTEAARVTPPGGYGEPPQGGTPTRHTPPPPPYPQGGYPYPPPGYPPYPYPPRAVKKGLPGWFWAIIAIVGVFMVLAVIGIVFFGMWFGDVLGKPLASVARFYSALDAGRCDEARSILSNDMQRVDYCARWSALKAQGETNPGGSDGGVSVRNSIATVGWRLTAGGRQHRVDVQLEEIGGQMRITGSFPDLLPTP